MKYFLQKELEDRLCRRCPFAYVYRLFSRFSRHLLPRQVAIQFFQGALFPLASSHSPGGSISGGSSQRRRRVISVAHGASRGTAAESPARAPEARHRIGRSGIRLPGFIGCARRRGESLSRLYAALFESPDPCGALSHRWRYRLLICRLLRRRHPRTTHSTWSKEACPPGIRPLLSLDGVYDWHIHSLR